MIDIVEYVEETYGIELLEYQKIYLRSLYDEYKNSGKLVYIPTTSLRYRDNFYQHILSILKELTQSGKTLNSNN